MESDEIKIYGKIYKVKPVSSSVSMQEVAALVDAKMKELSGVKGRSSTVDVAVLTALNLGHELIELKQGNQGDDDQLLDHAFKVLIQLIVISLIALFQLNQFMPQVKRGQYRHIHCGRSAFDSRQLLHLRIY
jgi:cell division protein ZapA (FtsZ GTPase activity inhibitor)